MENLQYNKHSFIEDSANVITLLVKREVDKLIEAKIVAVSNPDTLYSAILNNVFSGFILSGDIDNDKAYNLWGYLLSIIPSTWKKPILNQEIDELYRKNPEIDKTEEVNCDGECENCKVKFATEAMNLGGAINPNMMPPMTVIDLGSREAIMKMLPIILEATLKNLPEQIKLMKFGRDGKTPFWLLEMTSGDTFSVVCNLDKPIGEWMTNIIDDKGNAKSMNFTDAVNLLKIKFNV